MKILDLQTGRVHEYGDDPHDSLYVSNNGRYLTYYNLQNGDGSNLGDYRFVCDDDKIPAESETADALHAEVYFNIGGFNKRPMFNRSELEKALDYWYAHLKKRDEEQNKAAWCAINAIKYCIENSSAYQG